MTQSFESHPFVDKDGNQQYALASLANISVRNPPMFSGIRSEQDPLKFLQDFKDAAVWNNWRLDERKKEMFIQCLTGAAKDWFEVYVLPKEENLKALKYSDDTEHCLLARFKERFLTDDWIDKYEKDYVNRKQNQNKTVMDITFLPQEIKNRIAHHLDPVSKVYLGLVLYPLEEFNYGGPYTILEDILGRGADVKALLYMKEQVPVNIAISYAVRTKNIQVVKNVCSVWDKAKTHELGRVISHDINFIWGMENLGTYRDEMSAMYSRIIHGEYHLIPDYCHKYGKLYYADTIVARDVEQWVRDYPIEYLKYAVECLQGYILVYRGDYQLFLDLLEKDITSEDLGKSSAHGMSVEDSDVYFGEEPEEEYLHGRMYIAATLADELGGEFLNKAISVFNQYLNQDEKSYEKILRLLLMFLTNGGKNLIHKLSSIEGMEPMLDSCNMVIKAVENKDIKTLENLYPKLDTGEDTYVVHIPITREDATFLGIYTMVLHAYGFATEEEYLFSCAREYNFLYHPQAIFYNPDIFFTRILEDIQVLDSNVGYYQASMYHMQKLGYNHTQLFPMRYYTSGELYWTVDWNVHENGELGDIHEPEDFSSPMDLNAIYEYYKRDLPIYFPGISWWILDKNKTRDCIKWVLLQVLKEKLPLDNSSLSGYGGMSWHQEDGCVRLHGETLIPDHLCREPTNNTLYLASVMVSWKKILDLDNPQRKS